MAISAADVKKLRDATGAGMMDAKKALTEADGDFDGAVEILRIAGLAKAAKRADREATNGLVAAEGGTLIQLGAETDFVAKSDEFVGLAARVVKAVAQAKAADVASANAVALDSGTVADAINELAATIGEKLELREVAHFDGATHIYLHKRASDLPPQVGVMVEYTGGDETLAHNLCMQIASMAPRYVTREDVPADVVDNEKRIAEATAREEGKPEGAIPRIVEGRVGGFFKEVCLVDQAAVWEDKKSVGDVLKDAGATVTRFVRFSAGA